MFNELHPLPNEVIVLHEHLSYWLVWQNIDEVANYWPVAMVLECTTLTIHHNMIWNCVWKQEINWRCNQAWLEQSTFQTCTIMHFKFHFTVWIMVPSLDWERRRGLDKDWSKLLIQTMFIKICSLVLFPEIYLGTF